MSEATSQDEIPTLDINSVIEEFDYKYARATTFEDLDSARTQLRQDLQLFSEQQLTEYVTNKLDDLGMITTSIVKNIIQPILHNLQRPQAVVLLDFCYNYLRKKKREGKIPRWQAFYINCYLNDCWEEL